MSWVTVDEMRALENRAIARGVDAGTLMDQAAAGVAALLLDHFPTPGSATAYIGKGNNAGDAVAVIEILARHGWKVAIRSSRPPTDCTTLTRQRLRRCGIEPDTPPPHGPGPRLILDGLLGIGSRGGLREPLFHLAREIEEQRKQRGAIVAAIDLPSGLDADTGVAAEGTVIADLTFALGFVKAGLLADSAVDFCGRLFCVPLAGLEPGPADRFPKLSLPANLPDLLPPRPHSFHKGDAGRVTLLAGSPEYGGAAELCAAGALRGGAGLVTLFLDPDHPARPIPEIICRRVESKIETAFSHRADARVIGPGLGSMNPKQFDALKSGLVADAAPTVLDADALNALAAADALDLLAPHHLITPHPGEFARLAPDLAKLPRMEAVRRFTARHPCTLLLKGARSIIGAAGEGLYLNPTGHAGMASGGQGDVLAGVCGALLAGGMTPLHAGILGAWLCGRAAERALTHGGESEASLSASDTLKHLGGAFTDWKECRR
ncbi:MAG: NAD(P)H-hydrate dehydratase [Akkermansiaceae bacterium]|nr:NAD(P)H-hydrate dehydratase [Akkermansiaceae bacterium]